MKQHQDKKSMIVIKEDYMRNYCKITYILSSTVFLPFLELNSSDQPFPGFGPLFEYYGSTAPLLIYSGSTFLKLFQWFLRLTYAVERVGLGSKE